MPSSCLPSSPGTRGLRAIFYPYGYNDDDTLKSLGFMTGGYKASASLGQVNNVIDFNLNILQKSSTLAKNIIYGKSLNQNFLVELTGYFEAPVSGQYTFDLTVDDAAIMLLGAGTAFPCCNNDCDGNRDALFAHWNNLSKQYGVDSRSITLAQGEYYPIKIVYLNMISNVFLSLKVNSPQGSIELSDYTYTFANSANGCASGTKARRQTFEAFENILGPESPSTTTAPFIVSDIVIGSSSKLGLSIPMFLFTFLVALFL